MIIYIIIIVLLFILFYRTNKHYHFISKITILTFLNVEGAFILAEIGRNLEDLSVPVC